MTGSDSRGRTPPFAQVAPRVGQRFRQCASRQRWRLLRHVAWVQFVVVVVRFSVTELLPDKRSVVRSCSSVLRDPSGLVTMVDELLVVAPVAGFLLE